MTKRPSRIYTTQIELTNRYNKLVPRAPENAYISPSFDILKVDVTSEFTCSLDDGWRW